MLWKLQRVTGVVHNKKKLKMKLESLVGFGVQGIGCRVQAVVSLHRGSPIK